jgi:hypothetical protein
MTVLFDDGSPQPGTHVLLIGVGDYPFLKGGAAPAAKLFAHHMGMGQLSSPPKSVEELARWFFDGQDGFNNPERPLRSLQMLCSAAVPVVWAPQGAAGQPVAKAKTAGVAQAIKDWMARTNRNEENLAFLYFCGHGLSFGETQNSLLLEDFGGDVNDPMSNAIAFDELRLGLMRQCEARYQCHFIDACRTLPIRDFIDTFGDENTGIAVVSGGLSKKLRDKLAPVFFATGLASVAYGLQDQASLFLQGMLRCFRGVGSRDADDHYEVIVEAVAEGINKCVESLAFQTQPQYCQPRDAGHPFPLHRVRGDPEVIVKVFTRNETLLANTILSHTSETTNVRTERKPLAAPWWVPLPLGKYLFQAVSAQDATVVGQQSKYVSPPGAQVGL